MKAVIDANVAVSAAINPVGPPAQVLLGWQRGAFTWVTSAPLLDELTGTFSTPRVRRFFSWQRDEIDDFFGSLLESAEIVSPQQTITRVTADPDDNRVLEAAVESEADFIVTGDRHLLEPNRHEGTEIVTPAQFLAILAEVGNQ